MPSSPTLRLLPTDALSERDLGAIRALMDGTFGTGDEAFGDDDWDHALGGVHAVLEADGEILAHAAVVERAIEIGGRAYRTGYVEAVATAPSRQGGGLGSIVMEAVDDHIRTTFELGVLGTGRHSFYQRIGWQTWLGPLFLRGPAGPIRTPDDEGYLLVLRTPTSPRFELTEPISCEWRPGDVW